MKTLMSNSSIRQARKKQHREFMKQAEKRNVAYRQEKILIIEELKNCPSVHDFNNLDS